jgi:hypothetical protein
MRALREAFLFWLLSIPCLIIISLFQVSLLKMLIDVLLLSLLKLILREELLFEAIEAMTPLPHSAHVNLLAYHLSSSAHHIKRR